LRRHRIAPLIDWSLVVELVNQLEAIAYEVPAPERSREP
jgi:hypothetical protein